MLKKMNSWWENICHGCGVCCQVKDFQGDIVYINMEKSCKYLDSCNKNCTIYDDRFKKNPDCSKVNIYQALFNPYLPGSCGYVKKFRFWKRSKNG